MSVVEKSPAYKKELLNCEYCDFETSSKRGLNVHKKRKHTNLKNDEYPVECDFCDILLNSEKELKLHLKSNHTHRETKFKIVFSMLRMNSLLKYTKGDVILRVLNVACVTSKQKVLEI